MSRAQTPLFFSTRLVFSEPYLHVPFGCGLVLKCPGRCPVRFCLPSAFRCRDSGTRLVQGKEASPVLQQHKRSYSEHRFGLTRGQRMLWESESVPGGDYPLCCGSGALARPAPGPAALRSHQQRTRVVQQHWGRRGASPASIPCLFPWLCPGSAACAGGAAGARGLRSQGRGCIRGAELETCAAACSGRMEICLSAGKE